MVLGLAQQRSLIALFASILVVLLIVMSRPAFRQKPDTVVIRMPGCRLLGPPQPAQPEAVIDLDYALLSLAAPAHVPLSRRKNNPQAQPTRPLTPEEKAREEKKKREEQTPRPPQ